MSASQWGFGNMKDSMKKNSTEIPMDVSGNANTFALNYTRRRTSTSALAQAYMGMSLHSRVLITVAGIMTYVLGGATFYYLYMEEEWSFVFCVYFVVQMLTMVGYGDDPRNNSGSPEAIFGDGGMVFSTFFGAFGLLLLTIAVRFLVYAVQIQRQKRKRIATQNAIDDFAGQEHRFKITRRSAIGFTFHPIRDTAFFIGLLSIGIIFSSQHEDYDFAEAFYWTVMTATSIGFGDLHPVNASGYWFSIFYSPVLVFGFGLWCFSVTQWLDPARSKVNVFMKKKLSPELLHMVGVSDERQCTEADFLAILVTSLGSLDAESVQILRAHFRHLDRNNDGVLSFEDIPDLPINTRRVEANNNTKSRIESI
eukprot:m.191052 g.191052  ORF g.191052 m.191052 type:complete len:366 (-) comp18582_c0_seq9:232-1329(-)